MTDEKYSFVSDVRDKKVTARSARSKRTHTGKGGRVRLPSDNLSKKELQKMNGECKSYKLNSPMTWKEFKSLPDDIRITYIKMLRKKYNIPDQEIANMLGIGRQAFIKEVARLGISKGKKTGGRKSWDKDDFYAWWHGVDMLPTPVPEEPAAEPIPEEKEAFVEDDLPYEEQVFVPVEKYRHLDAEIACLTKRIDELLMTNEELMAVHEKDKAEIAWLRNECDRHHRNVQILEAQMEVVRMIFGGRGNGN